MPRRFHVRGGLVLCLLTELLAPRATAAEPIAEIPGALLIVGGGPMPDAVRDRFVELAGGERARLVVIPTAGDGDFAGDAGASVLSPWKALKLESVELLHTRDRDEANAPEFVKALGEATGVWLGGGLQKRLADAYRGTAVERELRALLRRGGVIGGTSAGAAIMSDLMIESGNPDARTGPGLGLLPGFAVDQHFLKRDRVNRSLRVLEQNPGRVGLGIDEATAVEVRGRRLRVLGDSYVLVCLAPGNRYGVSIRALKAGDTADLFQLRRAALARAGEPFPAQEPRAPVVEKGTLILGGGGGMPAEVWKRFVELAGGPEAPVVVVPTALGDNPPAEPGEARVLKRAGAKNVRVFHTTDRAKANDPGFTKVLRDAKGIWFSGGRQWRFVDAYEGTLAEELFHEVLKRGGVIAGSSAGASIQSEYMPRGHPLGNTVMMAEGYERGFGFLPGCAVDQHFFARKRTADMTALVERYPMLLGIGIDEGTVLVVRKSVAEVVGRGKVAVYDRRKPLPEGGPDYEVLLPGERYDLKERRKVGEAGR
ncbi:MAG TPA: cyanophycinase [Gemmataceae bacterium]